MNKRNSTARLIPLLALVVTGSQTGAQPIYTPYAFTDFVGPPSVVGPGTNDGVGSVSRFNLPEGVAVDNTGNVYVADTQNNTIRKITPAGVVTTLAGSAGQSGSVDGTGSAARFNTPSGVAVDNAGNLYVADTGNETIRTITLAGVVTTLAGSAGKSGSVDGTGSAARFNTLSSLALDGAGNLYVADTPADSGNGTIRMITPAGMVSTLTDNTGTVVLFYTPSGVAVDRTGTVYVVTYDNLIQKVTPTGGVVTLVAGCGGQGYCPPGSSQFNGPKGVAVDTAGNVYLADTGDDVIRKIAPDGSVATLAGGLTQGGSDDGFGSAARFYQPWGVAVDRAGNVYVADAGNDTIRKITPAGEVTTLAGSPSQGGSQDGTGTRARFNSPIGVAADSAGNIYVADEYNYTIRKVTPAGVVTTLAGSAGQSGSVDGTGTSALFSVPYGVAVDSVGAVYVADGGNDTIRKISPAGAVITLAGSAGQSGIFDGIGSAARFNSPSGLAVDNAGNVYVADSGYNTIRKITPAGAVTTLAGSPGPGGSADGVGYAARFYGPIGVAADSAGSIYVADEYNCTIRKVTPDGSVTTLAGSAGHRGSADGTGSEARFAYPTGVAVDGMSNLYVADTGNNTIRKITPAAVVTTLAGSPGQSGSADGTGSAVRFSSPLGVAVDRAGNLYVADGGNNRIIKGTPVLQFEASAGSLTVSSGLFEMRLTGPVGNNVVVEKSGNLQTWTPLLTNALPADGLNLPVPVGTNQRQFFRARLAP
jgi:sugar lactone lactonase YvrE